MIHGQTLPSTRAFFEPLAITLMVIAELSGSSQKMTSVRGEPGYLLDVSGGTSMIQGHTLAADLLPPLATTLMLSFMSRYSLVLCLRLAELIDGNVNEPRAENSSLRFAGAFFVLGHCSVSCWL